MQQCQKNFELGVEKQRLFIKFLWISQFRVKLVKTKLPFLKMTAVTTKEKNRKCD